MQPVESSRPLTANLACFAAMAFWAIGFPAGDILLETWGTVSLIVVRLVLSIICLMLFWHYSDGFSAIKNAPWQKAILIGGTGFGLGALLLLFGQKLSDPVTPAIAAAMMPITGAILEVFLDGRRLRIHLIIGILLALGGGLLATGAQLTDSSFGVGALICLVAVSLFAWATRAATKDLQTLSPIGQTTATLVGGLGFNLVMLVCLWMLDIKGTEIGTLDGNNVFHLLIFAISSLAIAQFLWILGAGKLGILLASFHMNAMPFYVMVFLVLFFDGFWNWNQALGAALVALGVIVAQSFPRRTEPVQERQPTIPQTTPPAMQPCQPFMWTGT